MNKVRPCIGCGGPWALASAVAVSLPAAFTPAVTAQCDNPDPTPACDGQIGIQGNFDQGCDGMGGSDDIMDPAANDGWISLAFPFQTNGASVDAVTFTLNTNRAGGDIWIVGNIADPTPPPDTTCGQPDITNVLAVICCALEGLPPDTGGANPVPITHTVNFGAVATSAAEPTWVIFVGRTGLAGLNDLDGDGEGDLPSFNGRDFPSHQVTRDCNEDPLNPGTCLTASSPGQAFANLQGTGNPGDWTDLDTVVLGGQAIGTPYCVDLIVTGNPSDNIDCLSNPPATGVCCLDTPECVIEVGYKCGIQGGIYGGDSSTCLLNPFGACTCGPAAGGCIDPDGDGVPNGNGTAGCELLRCCEVICINDPACCSFEWDLNCAQFAAGVNACALCPVLSHQKISDTEGDFTGILDNGDAFGRSAVSLGDLDGDGVGDLAVGAWRDDDGGTNRGAVWILFLNTNGTVKSHQKISDTEGGFTGILDDGDLFGISVASLGDLDGAEPSVLALAVGAPGDDDGGLNHGAVWILFLNPDGTVNSHKKISDTEGGFTGILDDVDNFGSVVGSLGDLDGDGVVDLAVGAWRDDDGCTVPADCDRGAVWILFLNADGTVKSHQKISDTQGGFTGTLVDGDAFGISVASLGDLDGAGPSVLALAVGAAGVDGSNASGAAWILFLNVDTTGVDPVVTVLSHQKISNPEVGGEGFDDRFGASVGSLGDLDGDGVGDLAVGAFRDDDGGANRGAVWILFLNTNGTVKSHQKISDTCSTGLGLGNGDQFGIAAAPLGDLDGDGVGDLAVGAQFDDDGSFNRGAVYILFLDGVPPCPWDCQAVPSGSVDVPDLLALLGAWGGPQTPGTTCDFDGSGVIAVPDLLKLLANWGPCP